MNIFSQIGNIYTNQTSSWMSELNDSDIQPFLINRFLVMNDDMRRQSRILDRYTFYLPPKMFLSMAWSIIPKREKAPFVKYIKKNKDTEEFDFILDKVRKHFSLSDNDYNSIKGRLIEEIKKDMPGWFRYYGIEKKYWKKYMQDFNNMKEDKDKAYKKDKVKDIWSF